MGFFDSGSEESSSNTTQTTDMTNTRKSLNEVQRNDALRAVGGLATSGLSNAPLVAGSNANIDAGQAALMQAAQQQQGILGQQGNVFGQLQGLGSSGDDIYNQYKSGVESAGSEMYNQLLAGARGQEQGVGQSGGTARMKIDAQGARGVAADTQRQLADFRNQQLGRRQQALTTSLGATPMMLQSQLAPAQAMLTAGHDARNIENEQAKEQMMREQMRIQRLQALSGSAGNLIGLAGTNRQQGTVNTNTTQTTPTASPFSQAAGLAMAGGSLMAGNPAPLMSGAGGGGVPGAGQHKYSNEQALAMAPWNQ